MTSGRIFQKAFPSEQFPEMLEPKRGMKTNGNVMRWLLPQPLEKLMKWRLFKKEIMLSLKHLVSVHYQQGPKMSGLLS